MKLKSVAFLLLSSTVSLSALLVPAAAATQSTIAQSRERVYIAFEIAQTSDQLLTIFGNSPVQPLGFRHEQEFVGEYFVQTSKTLAQNITEYETLVQSDFGASPRVVGVYVMPPQVEAAQSVLASRVESNALNASKSSPRLISWAKSVSSHRPHISSPKNHALTALSSTNLPATPVWAPNTLSGRSYQSGTYTKFYSMMSWSWTNHSPKNSPDDWGFEYDWSLYNQSLEYVRPFCVLNNDTKFWASRQPEIISWSMWVNGTSLNGSDNYGAYLDANDVTDDCARLGFAIGIGFPQNLPTHPSIQMLITAHRGTLASSVHEIQAQMTTNDCFFMPDSNCMGLDQSPYFPLPGGTNHSVVEKEWAWRSPSCYTHVSSGTATQVC